MPSSAPARPPEPAQDNATATLQNHRAADGWPRGRIDAVVHLGFAVLMVASAVRYVMRHSPADNIWILALAAAVCALYAVIAVLAQRRRPWALWMFVLAALWAVLVIAASSFAWCSSPCSSYAGRRSPAGWRTWAEVRRRRPPPSDCSGSAAAAML
jgi:hypothetical protein